MIEWIRQNGHFFHVYFLFFCFPLEIFSKCVTHTVWICLKMDVFSEAKDIIYSSANGSCNYDKRDDSSNFKEPQSPLEDYLKSYAGSLKTNIANEVSSILSDHPGIKQYVFMSIRWPIRYFGHILYKILKTLALCCDILRFGKGTCLVILSLLTL